MSFVANNVRDKIGWYWEQARDTTADIIMLLLQQTGLEVDATLADYDDLAALLAGTNDEATATNYVRKTMPTPTRTVQDASDRVLLGAAAPGTGVQVTWVTLGSASGGTNNSLGKVLFVYDPNPGVSTDAQKLVLSGQDISAQTDGNDLVVTVNVDGVVRVRTP